MCTHRRSSECLDSPQTNKAMTEVTQSVEPVFTDAVEEFVATSTVLVNSAKRFKPGSDGSDVSEMEEVRSEISGMKLCLEKVLAKMDKICDKIDSIEKKFEAVVETVKKQGEEVSEMKKGMELMEQRMLVMEDKVIDQEARSRRNNLVFHGVEEKVRETDEESREILEKMIKSRCKIPERVVMERVHRLGQRPKPGTRPVKPRPIIARFLDYNQRERVRRARRDLPKEIRVSEDHPWQIRQARGALSKDLDEEKDRECMDCVSCPSTG